MVPFLLSLIVDGRLLQYSLVISGSEWEIFVCKARCEEPSLPAESG